MAGRVFVYGLDGVPLWLLRDAVKKGYLNTISRLMDNGVYGVLNAVPPINTPPNWYSAFTGVDPGVHGIIGFYTLDNQYRIKYYSARDRKVDPVWVIASRHGKRCVIVNAPLTYPPDRINGYMIGDDERYGAPTREHVYPDSIYELAKEAKNIVDVYMGNTLDEALDKLYNNILKRGEVTRKLMDRDGWDLTIVVYRETDYVMHKFLGLKDVDGGDERAKDKYHNIPYETLSLLDDELRRYLEYLDSDDHVIIMSDHGHKTKKFEFRINVFKSRHNLLKLKHGGGRRVIKVETLRRIGILRWLWYRLSYNTRSKLKSILFKVAEHDKSINPSIIDWSKTKAICFMKSGAVKINLMGRDKEGIVSKEEYKRVLDEVKRILMEENERRIREGMPPIIRGIYSVDEVYREYDDPLYPDILIIPHDDTVLNIHFDGEGVVTEMKTNISFNTPLTTVKNISDHILEGMYVFSGPAFKKIGLGPKLSMMDITPYILYLLDIPIPSYVQGRINKDILSDEWLKVHQPKIIMSKKFEVRARVRRVRRKIIGE